MSQQENLRIIREAFEAWNAHDVDRYTAMLDEGYVEETHTRPTPVRGREAGPPVFKSGFLSAGNPSSIIRSGIG